MAAAEWWFLRLVRRLARVRTPAPFSGFRFVPTPGSPAELADLTGRYNWYLGDVPADVRVEGLTADVTPEPDEAPYFDPDLVSRPARLVDDHPGPGHLLVHRVTPGVLVDIVRARGAATIVDPRLHYLVDSFGYFAARRLVTYDDADSSHVDATSRLFALAPASGSTALVVGTGPGAQKLTEGAIDHDIRIVSNSAIRDKELLRCLQPNVVAFADHIFHFGPSRYAAEFRRDVARLAAETDCLFVIPEWGASLLLARLPQLRGRTIAVRLGPSETERRWLTPEDMTVRVTGNVLTQLMLPVALGVADRVDIAGCDGREPGSRYFWSHGRTVQYSDHLMRTTFESHLAFFRDTDYADYYDKHCNELARMLEWAEAAGKTVRSVTSSHIPALAARAI